MIFRRSVLLVALVTLLGPSVARADELSPDDVKRIVAAEVTDAQHTGLGFVRSLADNVGQRLTGSDGAARGVEWAEVTMKSLGMSNVHREPVRVPHWVRGDELVELTAPRAQRLHAVALGGSVGTTGEGISADVIEVASFAELTALGERARGHIVLFNHPMPRTVDFSGYGSVVPLRTRGATAAARLGAVAVLVRSTGTGMFQLPHTGAVNYDKTVARIPAVALSADDTELVHRLLADSKTVRVHLRLGAADKGMVDSFNVVGDWPGTDHDELVILGAHLDSWDLGTGAIDDAAGCAIVLEAGRLLHTLNVPLRRTLRVVLFMNEEHGLDGARAFAAAHAAEVPHMAAAIEADSGDGRPLGYAVAGEALSLALVGKWVAALPDASWRRVIHADDVGADITPLQTLGVPVLAVDQEVTRYFDWHHTAADTFDKVDPRELAETTAAVAVVAAAAANAKERLPAPTAPHRW